MRVDALGGALGGRDTLLHPLVTVVLQADRSRRSRGELRKGRPRGTAGAGRLGEIGWDDRSVPVLRGDEVTKGWEGFTSST